MSELQLIPVQASTFAEKVDPLFYFLTLLTVVLTVGICIGVVILGAMYRKRAGSARESKPLENPLLEMTWTVIPFIVVLFIFGWGAVLYADYQKVPEGALEIDVVGKQWMWKVQHPDGKREVNALHVPVGQPVKITLASQDVLHSFFVPSFRVKQDVIPGRFTQMWFEATKVGEYHLFCAEYCGAEHSLMGGTVYVMDPEDYIEWLEGGPQLSPVDAGEFLFGQRGCVTCHNANPDSRGPNLEGVFGSTGIVRYGSEAREVLKDEEYLRESILNSSLGIVEGYTPLMPQFGNQLSDEEVNNLIEYIKSLGGTVSAEDAAAQQ